MKKRYLDFRARIDTLSDDEIVRLYQILFRYVGRYHSWVNADDAIVNAIVAALQGNRKWPAHKKLETFLQDTIRSQVNHFYVKETVEVKELVEELSDQPRKQSRPRRTWRWQPSEQFLDDFEDPNPTSPQQQLESDELLKEIRHALSGDPLSEIFELYHQGMTLQEVADILEISMDEMQNVNKRLKRRLSRLGRKS